MADERKIAEAIIAARTRQGRRGPGWGSAVRAEVAALEKLIKLADSSFPPEKPRHESMYWTGDKLVRWNTHTKEYEDA